MAIIYTYPTKSVVETTDLVIITDKSSSSPKDQTKQASISSIKDAINVVDSLNTFTGALIINSGAGISVSNADPNITIANTGVLSVAATSPVATSSATGAITLSLGTVPVNKGGTNMTSYSQGDLITAASSSALDVVNIGTAGQVLKVNAGATAPEWSSDTDTTYTAGDGLDLTGTVFSTDLKANGGIALDTGELVLQLDDSAINGVLEVANGGVGLNAYSAGDILYYGSGPQLSSLAIGTAGQVLKVNAGATAVEWGADNVGPVTGYTNGTSGYILTSSGASTINGQNNLTFDGATRDLTLTGQLTATATIGNNTAIRGVAANATSTQGWNIDLGVANFDQNDTSANCTTIAVNTESTSGRLISFYYQENSGTGPKGEIKYDTGTSQVQYNVTSDYRLKENVVDLTSAVDRVKNLKPKRFNFIGNATEIDGFLAHEVQEVVPQAVSGVKDQMFEDGQVKPQQMDASKLIPVLTAAIKELTARIEALEA